MFFRSASAYVAALAVLSAAVISCSDQSAVVDPVDDANTSLAAADESIVPDDVDATTDPDLNEVSIPGSDVRIVVDTTTGVAVVADLDMLYAVRVSFVRPATASEIQAIADAVPAVEVGHPDEILDGTLNPSAIASWRYVFSPLGYYDAVGRYPTLDEVGALIADVAPELVAGVEWRSADRGNRVNEYQFMVMLQSGQTAFDLKDACNAASSVFASAVYRAGSTTSGGIAVQIFFSEPHGLSREQVTAILDGLAPVTETYPLPSFTAM